VSDAARAVRAEPGSSMRGIPTPPHLAEKHLPGRVLSNQVGTLAAVQSQVCGMTLVAVFDCIGFTDRGM